jgi:hypothetical protein
LPQYSGETIKIPVSSIVAVGKGGWWAYSVKLTAGLFSQWRDGWIQKANVDDVALEFSL